MPGLAAEDLRGEAESLTSEFELSLAVMGMEFYRWLRIDTQPVTLDGRCHVLVVIEDATNRKVAEKEARRTRRGSSWLCMAPPWDCGTGMSPAAKLSSMSGGLRCSDTPWTELDPEYPDVAEPHSQRGYGRGFG